jgi:hypothetical protein
LGGLAGFVALCLGLGALLLQIAADRGHRIVPAAPRPAV